MTDGAYRVYLWRYSWGDFDLWKIGCTGMGAMDRRIAAWNGWLGMTSTMTRELTGRTGRWVCETVAESAFYGDSTSARRAERGLHDRYSSVAVGHELFRPHPDFGPEFFGVDGAPTPHYPLLVWTE